MWKVGGSNGKRNSNNRIRSLNANNSGKSTNQSSIRTKQARAKRDQGQQPKWKQFWYQKSVWFVQIVNSRVLNSKYNIFKLPEVLRLLLTLS